MCECVHVCVCVCVFVCVYGDLFIHRCRKGRMGEFPPPPTPHFLRHFPWYVDLLEKEGLPAVIFFHTWLLLVTLNIVVGVARSENTLYFRAYLHNRTSSILIRPLKLDRPPKAKLNGVYHACMVYTHYSATSTMPLQTVRNLA